MFSEGFLCKVLPILNFFLYNKQTNPTNTWQQKPKPLWILLKKKVTKEIKRKTAANYGSTSLFLILKKGKIFF